MTNPFENMTSEAAIKSAYRKLSKQCHPDLRPDKDVAASEFRELTRIYQLALKGIIEPATKKDEDWWHRDPAPPPPPPSGQHYAETIDLGHIDNFEFEHWGEALRTIICSRAILLHGGVLRIKFKTPKMKASLLGMKVTFGQNDEVREFDVPPNMPNPTKVRIKLPIGSVILTLVGRR